MKTNNKKEKKIILKIVKDGITIPVVIYPETRVEDFLLSNGLVDFRVGFLTKGPFFRDSEKIFKKVHSNTVLPCVYYAD